MLQIKPRLLLQPVHMVALGFGSGLAPRAPGTAGSALATALAWLIADWPLAWRIGIAACAVAAGLAVCGPSARRLGVDDHPAIVIDEIAAMLALAIAAPRGVVWLLGAFALFRLFDIVKPWPIRDVDHRLKGSLGIMLDDVLAAAYAAVCLRIVQVIIAVS